MRQDPEGVPITEIREEIAESLKLIEAGASAEASSRLARLTLVLDKYLVNQEAGDARARRGRKRKPLSAWEYESALHPTRRQP